MSNAEPPPLFVLHRHLRREAPSLNMRRFYTLSLQNTLFGEVTLTRHWGRIGTRGQSLSETFTREEEAVRAFEQLLGRKRRRGYGEVA